MRLRASSRNRLSLYLSGTSQLPNREILLLEDTFKDLEKLIAAVVPIPSFLSGRDPNQGTDSQIEARRVRPEAAMKLNKFDIVLVDFPVQSVSKDNMNTGRKVIVTGTEQHGLHPAVVIAVTKMGRSRW